MRGGRHIMVVLALAVAGCAAAPSAPKGSGGLAPAPDDPTTLLAMLASPATPEDSRIAADRKLVESAPREARLAVLEQMVYQPGQSERMRIYAIDQLAAADASRCARVLSLQLPRMDDWAVLAHACEVAAKLEDPRLVGPLVRSLVRPATSRTPAQRPEAKAIESLSGKKLADALVDTVVSARDTDTRVAAIAALPEFVSDEDARRRIGELTPSPSDGFMRDMQWAAAQFSCLPRNRNEADWLVALRKDPLASQHVAAMHKAFAGDNEYAFAPRFAGILALARTAREPVLRQTTAGALAEDIEARLKALPHAAREASYPKAPDDVDESFAANRKKLTRCDLLTIRVLLDGLARPEFRREVVRLGLDDLSDTASEHGGLIAPGDPARPESLMLEVFKPFTERNDQTYLASDKLLAAIPRGIAQFHFHFQQIHNEAHAGPGAGDLEYARTSRVSCVVFTSMGRNRFDVDYYTPSGAVVDLGVYTGD